MERFLCIDIGEKRIGVAVSDPFNSYALPVYTYHRVNLKTDLMAIAKLVKEKCATALVCGVPVNFDGTPSKQTQRAIYFIQKLEQELNVPIYTADERCTTCEAEEVLISQGMDRKERKNYVDSLAATSILQGFLSDKNKYKSFKETIMSDKEKKNCCHDSTCDCGCQEEKHNHDCDCNHEDCNCGCQDDFEDIVELTTDDGSKLKFYFIGTIEYKGKNYSAFEPAEEIEGCSEDDLIIFELSGDDEETAELLPIEDEGLLNEVFEEFCRVLEEDELAEEAMSLEPDQN